MLECEEIAVPHLNCANRSSHCEENGGNETENLLLLLLLA